MGFFKKLFGALGAEKEKDVSATDNTVVAEPPKSDYSFDDANPCHNQHNTGEDYFASLITKENFPEYEIERNLHPNVFDESAHPSCLPISFLFKKDDEPVLAVLVMKTNQYRAMIALGTYEILDENSIPYIRFFKGMLNQKDYVINRIKEELSQEN